MDIIPNISNDNSGLDSFNNKIMDKNSREKPNCNPNSFYEKMNSKNNSEIKTYEQTDVSIIKDILDSLN